MRVSVVAATVALMLLAGCQGPDGQTARKENVSAMSTAGAKSEVVTEKAMFGAGCFWGVESRFMAVPGVVSTAVGYSGGKTDHPTYKQVCGDGTGHAEVVYVEYDPQKVSYEQLLEVFWANHDPTQVNRQGPDVGTQYRSVIFYYTPEQERIALASKERLGLSGKHQRPIATEVTKAGPFWRAEEYHQKYLQKRGLDSCGTGH